ncbi:DUF58 domain-containing protein [Halovivax limisalsi]|uniref:DUF58 domain-containing protein n=1 Tax=Halovivax limisalsi TaxID=1453760 RepID=UPI001FFC4B7C|nr:DUF58 domain-containing protein [Halovivax limisalsi]
MTDQRRFWAGLAVALVASGTGLLLGNPALFAASLVGITYATYTSVGTASSPALAVERTIEPDRPSPGETLSVSLSVRNEGSAVLPDVRITDSPPESHAIDGEARGAASLPPGETVTVEYDVRPRRGEAAFGDVTVETTAVSGSDSTVETYPAARTIRVEDDVERVPLAGRTIGYAGRLDGEAGGEGIEFYGTRPYQPMDPVNRIDWRGLARSGTLSTVEYRQDRAVAVVCLADARASAAVRRRAGEHTARALCRRATRALATSLLDDDNRVGAALFGGRGHYLLPGVGRPQRARLDRFLDGTWERSFGHSGWLENGRRDIERCCRHLSEKTHLLVCSPLLDDDPVAASRRFAAFGHDVTVVSPAVIPETPGGTVIGVLRDDRLASLREAGIHVVDWSPDEPLQIALDRAERGWRS